MAETEKKVEKIIPLVCNEKDIPKQTIRTFIGDDKKEYEAIPVNEAITEILIKVREMHKSVLT